jgi:peptidoglycan/LPS O-acetylase OafA/YrhL
MGTVRFLLALSVVIAHSPSDTLLGLSFLPGATAVQAFYVISGFLITMVLNERKDYQSVRKFYIARYLRLWPTYILVAALALVVLQLPSFAEELPEWSLSTTLFVAFANFTLLFQDWFHFLEVHGGALAPTADFGAGPEPQLYTFLLVPQAWTLGVELTFYLVAPLLCRRLRGVAALFLFGLAVRLAIGLWRPPLDPWSYRFAPAEMMLFAAGGLSYFAARAAKITMLKFAYTYGAWMGLAAIATMIVAFPEVSALAPGLHLDETARTIYLQRPGFILLTVVLCPALFYGFRRVGFDMVLGELSYPIYISHLFVLEVLSQTVPEAYLASNLLPVACVVAVSAALLVLIAFPIDRIRARFGAHTVGARFGAGITAAADLPPSSAPSRSI